MDDRCNEGTNVPLLKIGSRIQKISKIYGKGGERDRFKIAPGVSLPIRGSDTVDEECSRADRKERVRSGGESRLAEAPIS